MAYRHTFARVLSLIVIVSLLALATSSSTLAAPGGSKLSKQDRERLATATANGA